jgi:predicted Zn-dependent protease
LAGAALVVAIGAAFYVRERAEARRAARLAREAIAARRDPEAGALLARWAALEPRSGEPEFYRAMLEVQSGSPAEALDAMRRAIALGHPEPPVLVLRAILLARAGRPDEAEPVLARAFQDSDEPRAEVAESLSRIYLNSFRLAEAARVLDGWARFAPEDARLYLRRNEIDERTTGDPAVLIRNYREALRRDPGLNEARLGLAEKLREASLIDEAQVEFAELLRRDPKNIRGLVGEGGIALLKGDIQTAIHDYQAALELDPKERAALRELGLIDLSAGRVSQALARLKLASELDPFEPEAHYCYSRALRVAGETARAAEEAATTERLKKEKQRVADLRQTLVQQPENADVRCEVARWLIEHGHEKEGLEWTHLILRQKPGHPATCRLLVDFHARRGEHGLANYYRTVGAPSDRERESPR